MKLRIGCVLVGFLSLVLSLAAQTSGSSPASAPVPPLLNFSGVLSDVSGKPLAVTVGVTFALYKDQQGGAPLWLETQNVKPNSAGHYTVTLGSTTSQGIPANLFTSGEARWLGAQVQGQSEQPRVQLVSAPYALKAGDAATLGGKPASAFLAASANAASGNNAIVDPVTGGGKKDYVPLWLSKTKLGKSNLFQSPAGDLGIGTTTPASTLDVQGTGSIRDTLTLFPQGTDPTLSVQGTGFGVSSTGVVSFVSGQTFPGTGTVTSVGSGSGLTGGPITSNGTLSIATGGVSNAMLVNPGLTVTAGTDLTGGGAVALGSSTTLNLDTSKVPQLNAANTFTGNQTVNGNLSSTGLDVQGTGSVRDTLTLFPKGTDPTLSVQGTGFGVSSTGVVSFVSGQTFSGAGTVTSVGSGAGLTGGPITGNGTLSIATGGVSNTMLVNPGLTVTAGTDLTGGGAVALGSSTTLNLDTSKVPQLNAANTFTGNQAVNGNLSATGVVAGSSYQIGSNLFAFGSYANANAFLGFAGNASATGIENTASGFQALTAITSGAVNVASGWQALFANTTGNENTAIGGQALAANTTGGANTATGYGALQGNTTGGLNTANGWGALATNTAGFYNTATGFEALFDNTTGYYNTASGYQALLSNNTGIDNTAEGYQALYTNTTGFHNTATGVEALFDNTTGLDNTASGYKALYVNNASYNTASGSEALSSNTGYNNTASGAGALADNTTGGDNTAVGALALYSNTTGNNLTCIGFQCSPGVDGLHNATAIGAHAIVGASNALVLGGTGQYAVKVGIGTTTPSSILTIARGAGHPVSDSWETYSSRRWKTNIRTLPNALAKIEQLRGVSYDQKDSGKHEIGVIAEEVGAVVPEVVSYEKGGKDASGVDYSRLTALLIEAVKQQQKQIVQQQKQIATQQGKIASQDKQLRRLGSKDALLESKLTELQGHVDELRQVKRSGPKAAATGLEVVAKAQF